MKIVLYFLAGIAFLVALLALYAGLSFATNINQSLAASLSPLRELGGGGLVDVLLSGITLVIQLAGVIFFLLFTAIGLLLGLAGTLVASTVSLAERVARLEAAIGETTG